MFKKYYLAYGSNLNINEMKNRCIFSKPIGSVILKDYRLVYKGSGNKYSYLTIEKSEGYYVPLGVYEISIFDIKSLDEYEGYPELYSKSYISININNKEVNALIYIMNEEFDYCLPSKDYIKICKEGYNDFGFDKTILDKALEDTINNLPKIKNR